MKLRFALLLIVIGLAASASQAQSHAARAVPSTIPTVALDNVGRQGSSSPAASTLASSGRTRNRRWAAPCMSK